MKRFAAFLLAAVTLGAAFAPAQDTLFTRSDTVGYRCGENEGTFTFSEMNDGDTLNIKLDCELVFLSDCDTLVTRYSREPADVVIVSKADTLSLKVIYAVRKIDFLRQYPDFGTTPAEDAPQFYYADPADSLLDELRARYNLDSVAGTGSETEKIINLMRWAHHIVKHDGGSTNPKPKNALNLISVCEKENRGVNCRMIATILNEAYLAMDFKSRHVTCMPIEKEFADCHVVNMVFSETLGKWLCMDPTFEGYLMDKDGTLVGISEVRQMLIESEPLLISDNVNWNGEAYDRSAYKNYLTKNLFRFFCPLGSEPGYESNDGNLAWVYLNPAGYDSEKAGTADTTGSEDSLRVDYYTDDADYFWTEP
ncbi:MAG: transglutaminase domain-containing protein [Candidatus Zixiibacteriota bacterium]|nr:MAG: transglutaminase domain-containing protein [candidate division Zixibacteria bacterium]